MTSGYEFPKEFIEAFKNSTGDEKINLNGIAQETLLLILMNYVDILGGLYSEIYKKEIKKFFRLKKPLKVCRADFTFNGLEIYPEFVFQNDSKIMSFTPLNRHDLNVFFFEKMLDYFHDPKSRFYKLMKFWEISKPLLWSLVRSHWIDMQSNAAKELSQNSLVFTKENKKVYFVRNNTFPKPQIIIVVNSDWIPHEAYDNNEECILATEQHQDNFARAVVDILGETPLAFQLVEHLVPYFTPCYPYVKSDAGVALKYFSEDFHKKCFPRGVREIIRDYCV